MNLDFRTIGTVEKDGVPYYLQSCDIQDNPRFWAAWNYAKQITANAEKLQAQIPEPNLTSIIRLNRQLIDGQARWIAYRMLPVNSSLPLYHFSESFRLRDPSGLLPFQARAVHYLCNAIINHKAAADGSDTGIGKTYHALSVAKNLVLRPGIICRKPGIAGWIAASKAMNVSPLFIANWEQVKNGKFPFCSRENTARGPRYTWKLPRETLLVFDEAHMGAVDNTQNNLIWLASKNLPTLSLSATFSDRPARLKSLLWLLGVVQSKSEYENWLSLRGHYVNKYDELEALDPAADMREINSVLYPRYGYRLSYSDPEVKAFFPDAAYQTEIVSLSKTDTLKQNRLYTDLLQKVEHYKTLGKTAEALNADMRYRQAAELLKAPVVADLARNYSDQGYSILIFVNFLETLYWFAKHFRTNSLILGEQQHSGVSREQVIQTFQENRSRLIVLMNQAGGQSISLHDLDGKHPRISLIFPTYDPVVLKQVLGRTHRAKGRSTPIMKLVYAANTIEEKVAESVNRKLGNISALNDGDLMEPDLFNMGI